MLFILKRGHGQKKVSKYLNTQLYSENLKICHEEELQGKTYHGSDTYLFAFLKDH